MKIRLLCIITLILSPYYLFSFYVSLDQTKKSSNQTCIIHHKSRNTTILFYLKKRTHILIPVKSKIKIQKILTKKLFKNIKTISSAYDLKKYKPIKLKIKVTSRDYNYKYFNANKALKLLKSKGYTFNKNNIKVFNYYKRKRLSFIYLYSGKKSGYFKITYRSNRLFIPLHVLRLKNLKAKLNYYVLADYRVKHPLFNTIFTQRFYCGKRVNNQRLKSYKLPNLIRIFPKLKNRTTNLTHLKANLIDTLLNDISLYPSGIAPLIFTKKHLINIVRKEQFSIRRKLHITRLLLKEKPNKRNINLFRRLWQTGNYTFNLPVYSWLNNSLFLKARPELFLLPIVKRRINLNSWIFFKSNKSLLVRMKLKNLGNDYRLLYTKNTDNKSIDLIMHGTDNRDYHFEKGFLFYSKGLRIVVIKKTKASLFAIDFNGYRNPNWQNNIMNNSQRNAKIKYFISMLNRINFSKRELNFILKYFK